MWSVRKASLSNTPRSAGNESTRTNPLNATRLAEAQVVAYQSADVSVDLIQARTYGKQQEQKLRAQAKSLSEYQDSVDRTTSTLLALATKAADSQEVEHIFPNLPESGATIGPYKTAQHYRNGISSEVFIARHNDTMLALKITTPHMLIPPHDAEREVRILKSLKGSPNITELLQTFSDSHNRLVLVFSFQPHELSALLANDVFPQAARKTVLRDIFTGLAHLHQRGLIHRDIKPANILLASATGPAYIADFGIAWSPIDKSSEPADAKIIDVGTTCYRPPELLFGSQAYGTELDLWAAGCVVAQVVCLGRQTLFDAGDLGSELALIKSIFQTLGTPDLDIWPEAAALPDWGKMNFVKYGRRSWEDILPACDPDALALVSSLVNFQSTDRLSAEQVLQHAYLSV